MPLYQFNEIYHRVTGEYENGIQILFFESEGNDILVYNGGFDLVNKPAQPNFLAFNRLFKNNKKTYHILRIAYKLTEAGSDDLIDETYVELEEAVIKIAWHFSTADGQQVKDFWLFLKDENRARYEDSLKAMESAREQQITDLRFI